MAESRDAPTKYSQVQVSEQESKSFHKSGLPRWSFHKNRSFGWMVLSLLSGIALSVGHHFFYAMFDGLQVEFVPISQTWIIRIGTVFAFAVKTLLVVAVSIAFVQHQFLALSNHQFKIRQIDTLTGVLGNALSFLESRLWFRFPLLTLLAGAAWLLPIAAIITPAAINVVLTEKITNSQGNPPQHSFDPKHYGLLNTEWSFSDYIGPSPDTLRAAFGSAMTGRILGVAQESPNMTYTLQFIGPALRCDHADANLTEEVYETYMKHIGPAGDKYSFAAWVPDTDGRGRGNLTAITKDVMPTLDLSSTDAAHIHIIPNTSLIGPYFAGREQMTSNKTHYGYQDLLDCKLYNASYKALFDFTFNNQAIKVQSREFLNPVNVSKDVKDWKYSKGTPQDVTYSAQRISYQSIMDSFGRLLVGAERDRDGNVRTRGSWNMMEIDWMSREGARQGLEQLFQNITLSMLSAPALTMNSTTAAKNRVLVDVRTYVNVYSYEPYGLLLAYGIACGVALIASLLGMHGIWRNGGVGYQSIFSTFVRTTRDHVFRDLIDPHDRGTEPLPKKLAESSITLDT